MSIHRTFRAALAVAGVASAAACAPAISSDRDEFIPIPQGATWAWGPRDTAALDERDPALGNEIVHQRLQRAIEAAMQAKGFHKTADTSQAEFLLTYYMGVRRSAMAGTAVVGMGFGWHGGWGRYHPWGRYSPWGWGWGWYGSPMWGAAMTMYPRAYGEGMLVAHLRQRSTGDVAWRAQYNMDVYDAHRLSRGRVQEVVNRLFNDLP